MTRIDTTLIYVKYNIRGCVAGLENTAHIRKKGEETRLAGLTKEAGG
jgi:hypothetical protein